MNTTPITSFRGEHALLSNFALTPIRLGGVVYPTAENAFQAAKNPGEDYRLSLCALSPAQARRAGRQVQLRLDWNRVRDQIMLGILTQKFRPGTAAFRVLMSTGDAPIVEENTWGDTYWGRCHGVGSNRLGVMLMSLRSRYAQSER